MKPLVSIAISLLALGVVDAASAAGEAPPTTRASDLDVASSGELALPDLIREALDRNPDLRAALERVHIAEAARSGARAAYFPRLSVSEGYGLTDNPAQAFTFLLNQSRLRFDRDFNDPSIEDNFHTRVRLQYDLYTGGRRGAEKRAADAQRAAAGHAREAVRNQLVFHVAEAYYRLLQSRDLLELRRQAVEQIRKHLEIVRTRLRAGTAVRSDVLSVQVRLAEADEARITAENRLELAWSVLESTVGTPVPRQPLPAEIPEAPWSDRTVRLQAALEAAVERRPELGRLESRGQAVAAEARAARSGYYPRLDFVSSYDFFTTDFSEGNDSFFVGLVARLILFDGGRTRSRVEQAEARRRALSAERESLRRDIELEVRRTHLQMKDAEGRSRVAGRAVDLARESLREIEVRYEAQAATITELIDAQVRLSGARVRHANARADVQTARSALQRSVGGLIDSVDIDAAREGGSN